MTFSHPFTVLALTVLGAVSWRPSDESFHSLTVILPSALDKPEYHEALPSSASVQSYLTSSFADHGNAS